MEGFVRFEGLEDQAVMQGVQVSAIGRDDQAVLWFGTDAGLLMFDGYELRADLFPELAGSRITALATLYGELWVGTATDGLYRVDPAKGVKQRYTGRADGGTLVGGAITCIHADSNNRIWIGSFEGLQRFDRTSNSFKVHLADVTVTAMAEDSLTDTLWFGCLDGEIYLAQEGAVEVEPCTRMGAEISALAVLRTGSEATVWAGTRGKGLFELGSDGLQQKQHLHLNDRLESLQSDDVRSILLDSRNQLWIGTDRGVSAYLSDRHRFINHAHETGGDHSLIGGQIIFLFEHLGVLWLGSDQGSICRLSLDRNRFTHFRKSLGGLVGDSIQSGLADQQGKLWVATSSGLCSYDPKSQEWRSPSETAAFSSVHFTILTQTRDGAIWAGTLGNGLNRYDPLSETVTVFRHDDNDSDSLIHDTVTALMEARDGSLWVGTAGEGVCKWDGRRFKRLPEMDGMPRTVSAFLEDSQGRKWIGAMNGLSVLQPGGNEWVELPQSAAEIIKSAHILCLENDAEGRVWIGTRGRGLLVLSDSLELEAFYRKDQTSIPSNDVYALLKEESSGDWWLATGNGLARFREAAKTFENFDVGDGLQSTRFHAGAAWKGDDGMLYFGGPNGFNEINPDQLGSRETMPRPVLRRLEYNGEAVRPGQPGSILKKPLMATSEIVIPFHESARIGFYFGTLDYANPLKSRFRYQLEGFDLSQSSSTTSRQAVYTSLPPNNYLFTVQSSPDGVRWNPDRASIKLCVVAPWYSRWWAKASMYLLVIGGVLFAVHLSFRRHARKILRQGERLELDNKRIEAALARQLQGSVLLNRTAKEIRHSLSRQHVFSATLSELTTHFKVDRSFVMVCEGDGGIIDGFKPILAAAHTAPGYRPINENQLPSSSHNSLFTKILARDKAHAVSDIDSIHGLRASWPQLEELEAKSMLLVRTSYLDQANGIIILQQCSHQREWITEELLLIDQVAGQVGIAIAQTDLHQREEQHRVALEQAKQNAEVANKAKSDFLAKITHELRTPLNTILGFCQLLCRDEETTPSQQETLSIINSSGEHLLDLINDVLDMSKIEADCLELNEETFNVHHLAESMRGMFRFRAEEKDLTMALEVDPNVPRSVTADVGKVRQTLINLIGNAIKFTNEGRITLRVKADGLLDDRCTLSFELEDTG
ncbi:MAG: ligand-binding sensor domain-containing protein/signal transduction histidine kinase, partial [Verrucomicrobiales bacterium]